MSLLLFAFCLSKVMNIRMECPVSTLTLELPVSWGIPWNGFHVQVPYHMSDLKYKMLQDNGKELFLNFGKVSQPQTNLLSPIISFQALRSPMKTFYAQVLQQDSTVLFSFEFETGLCSIWVCVYLCAPLRANCPHLSVCL